MKNILRCLVVWAGLGFAVGGLAAPGFLETLAPEQKKKLGLDHLTAQQQAELDAAIEGYRESVTVAATKAAAASAVEEYRRKEEPAVISRAVEVVKQKDAEARQERITAVIKGKFNGWSGNTLFTLDNGQVWRQSQPETYYIKAREDVAVVVYKGPGGYWRLRILDDEGAWVTVTRVQ
jgi:hypothetical protein